MIKNKVKKDLSKNYFQIDDDETLDFESNPDMKIVDGLTINYPEGIKNILFNKQHTLLGKILDGEFILKENDTENLKIIWKNGLLSFSL